MISHLDSHLYAHSLAPADWRGVRELCCMTGNAGAPIERERWAFYGDLWVEPYERFAPETAVVLRGADSRLLGYCTAAAHTLAFERYVRWIHAPRLISRIMIGHYPRNADTHKFMKQWSGRLPTADDFLGRPFMRGVKREYRGHLHINLVPEARGQGQGSALMSEAFEKLLRAGSDGVHVICGAQAVSFYRKTGFKELRSAEVAPGKSIFVLGRKL